jgi:hypothetical protein
MIVVADTGPINYLILSGHIAARSVCSRLCPKLCITASSGGVSEE